MSSTASLVFAATASRGALNLDLIFSRRVEAAESRGALSREEKVGVRLVWARFERSAEGNLLEYGGARAGCPALTRRPDIEKRRLKESNRAVDTPLRSQRL